MVLQIYIIQMEVTFRVILLIIQWQVKEVISMVEYYTKVTGKIIIGMDQVMKKQDKTIYLKDLSLKELNKAMDNLKHNYLHTMDNSRRISSMEKELFDL